MSVTAQTYEARAAAHPNAAARRLLETMMRKRTNLCISVDVTTAAEVLDVVRIVADSVCMVKTHIDIISDFTPALTAELARLADAHDFLIFEDRKFADIGNTVALQYSSGVHAIASWSHMTNAHPLPGPGIISGLGTVGRPLGRALLLLAEMSSKGNLATGAYTRTAVQMAREGGRDWVVGFIAMDRAHLRDATAAADEDDEDWLILTPGVGLQAKGDSLGQQYRSPHEVVHDSGCDVIIVGRGIYGVKGGDDAVRQEAERYRQEGWKAYEARLKA
ncbi:orotidine 5'-phosphate decarboxylase [Cryptotrichosporon argae]